MTTIGSLVLYAGDADSTAAFYRAIGIELENEEHDDGPTHFAAELGPVHFAIYPADRDGHAPERRAAGGTFPGFFVNSLDDVAAALAGSRVSSPHEQMPWGCRMVFLDPDGRPIEINQRDHCC